MEIIWENYVSFHRGIVHCDGKRIEDITIRDYTTPDMIEEARKNSYFREYAYVVKYCHGHSMTKGFDDECKEDKNKPEWNGTPKHTIDDIKQWCEEYIADMYISAYTETVQNLSEMRRKADWFRENVKAKYNSNWAKESPADKITTNEIIGTTVFLNGFVRNIADCTEENSTIIKHANSYCVSRTIQEAIQAINQLESDNSKLQQYLRFAVSDIRKLLENSTSIADCNLCASDVSQCNGCSELAWRYAGEITELLGEDTDVSPTPENERK